MIESFVSILYYYGSKITPRHETKGIKHFYCLQRTQQSTLYLYYHIYDYYILGA